jgi:hypothetical protein
MSIEDINNLSNNVSNMEIEETIKTPKYYFDNTDILNHYPTIWHGYLYTKIDEPYLNENSIWPLNDILVEICDVNFYIYLINNYIYLSICTDSRYYAANFEKHIRKAIKALEKKLNINIEKGEFFANECKPMGIQYKYTILKDSDDKISLKKITSCLK